MDVIIERCCGLDVHRSSVVACLMVGTPGRKIIKEIRKFGASSAALLELADWLIANGCTLAVMESTGVYWKPVHAVLEQALEVIVANARHVKQVPGRKTDMADAEWLATLARHGLVRASFVPAAPIRELREVVRYRRKVVQVQAQERNRVLKVLETAGVKLADCLSDVLGSSGRRLIRALLADETAPEQVAALIDKRLRPKLEQIQQALAPRLYAHHKLMLTMQMERIESGEAQVAQLDAEIDRMMAPYHEQLERLVKIPGIKQIAASAILAEIGDDMTHWKSADQLAAWAGVVPGNNESAGKRKSTRHRKGNVHLQSMLVECAWAASHAKNSYWRAKFYKLKARRGHNRALMAIARKMIIAVWHVLSGSEFKDLGGEYLDQLDPRRMVRTMTRRLAALGFTVTPTPALPDQSEVQSTSVVEGGFS